LDRAYRIRGSDVATECAAARKHRDQDAGILVFVLYVANTFFLPARSAIVPLLVPGDRLTEANSLMTFAGVTATIAGALAGGYLVARFGWRWGFALDALTYFVSVAALMRIRMSPAAREAPAPPAGALAEAASRRYRRTVGEVREGFSILLRTPRAWGATVAVMLLWTAGGVLHVAVPILTGVRAGGVAAIDEGRVASGVGTLLAAAACGMVVGTVSLAARGRGGTPRRRLGLALGGTGLSLAAFSLAPAGAAAMGAAFAAGIFVSLLLVTTETVLQESIPAAARGRVFSLRDVAARIMVLGAAAAAGAVIASGLSPRAAVLAVGAATAVAGAVGLVWRLGAAGSPPGAARAERNGG
jgi:MFS family permease